MSNDCNCSNCRAPSMMGTRVLGGGGGCGLVDGICTCTPATPAMVERQVKWKRHLAVIAEADETRRSDAETTYLRACDTAVAVYHADRTSSEARKIVAYNAAIKKARAVFDYETGGKQSEGL